MKKFIKSIAMGMALTGIISIIPSNKAHAATFQVNSERGIKYIAYSKDTAIWTTNSNSTAISAYETNQSRSGLFVQNNGVQKYNTLSTTKKYALLFKHTFLVGAVINGVTLGYNDDINDMFYIYSNGAYDISYDW